MRYLSRTNSFRSLAVLGWGYALAAWYALGHSAGVDPGFILGASVGITASLAAIVARVVPEARDLYAIAYREGQRNPPAAESPPLALVR